MHFHQQDTVQTDYADHAEGIGPQLMTGLSLHAGDASIRQLGQSSFAGRYQELRHFVHEPPTGRERVLVELNLNVFDRPAILVDNPNQCFVGGIKQIFPVVPATVSVIGRQTSGCMDTDPGPGPLP